MGLRFWNFMNIKILGVLKNYVGSFSSSVLDNVEKNSEKSGICYFRPILTAGKWTLSSTQNFGSKLVCHLCCFVQNFPQSSQIYYRNWRGCQMWFLKMIFFVPISAPNWLIYSLQVSIQLNLKFILESFSSLAACWLNPKWLSWLKAFFNPEPRTTLIQILSQLVFYGVFVTPCVNTTRLPILKLGFTTLSFLVTRNGSQLFTVKCVTAKRIKGGVLCLTT